LYFRKSLRCLQISLVLLIGEMDVAIIMGGQVRRDAKKSRKLLFERGSRLGGYQYLTCSSRGSIRIEHICNRFKFPALNCQIFVAPVLECDASVTAAAIHCFSKKHSL
jgi:hypothetical protein